MNLANYVTTNNPPLAEDRYFQAIEKYGNQSESLFLAYTKIALAQNRDRPPKLHAAVEVKVPDADLVMSYKPSPIYETMTDPNNGGSSQQSGQTQTSAGSILKRGLKRFRKERGKREPVFF